MTEQKRIHGTEMEWAAEYDHTPPNCDLVISERIPAATLMRWLRSYIRSEASGDLVAMEPSSIQYTSNGSRIYQDVGEHIEVATPEDDSFAGTTANEMAGERIMHDMIAQGIRNDHPDLAEKDLPKFRLHKRAIDEQLNVWGYHESYCVQPEAVKTRDSMTGEPKLSPGKLRTLGGHVVARSIFFGAGALLPDGSYVIAQKASQATEEFNTTTTNNHKPVVNLRDEALADDTKYSRVHNIMGDPNMSPWANDMKLATTSLIFRLMEHGIYLPHLHLENMHVAAVDIAHDTTLKKTIRLRSGKTITGLALEREYAEAALSLMADHSVELPPEEQLAAKEWLRACDETAKDPNWLLRYTDWKLKLHRLNSYAKRHNLHFKDNFAVLSGAEREWDRIDFNPKHKNIGQLLRTGIWKDWMPPESLIERRRTRPPTSTRAAIRAEFIRTCAGTKNSYAKWEEVQYKREIIPLGNPHSPFNARLRQIITEHTAEEADESPLAS